MCPILWGVKVPQAYVEVSGKNVRLKRIQTVKLGSKSWREVCGMRGVAVKCIDITQNSYC